MGYWNLLGPSYKQLIPKLCHQTGLDTSIVDPNMYNLIYSPESEVDAKYFTVCADRRAVMAKWKSTSEYSNQHLLNTYAGLLKG